MQFTPSQIITNITTNIIEIRTYRLLQELNDIESDQTKNQNALDNVSSERDEQSGRITASIALPCHITLTGGSPQVEIINPYQVSENINAAFFESAFSQWLGEQELTHNPTQVKYITMTQTFIPRDSPETGGSNATITFAISGLPTTREMAGESVSIQGAEYLQGILGG